jgi:hypothetical protein
MSTYRSETSVESMALIPVTNTSPSQLNDDLTIGINGSDEFKAKQEEATLDDSGFDLNWLDSVSKDNVKFPDTTNHGEVSTIHESDALSSQQLLSIVFGEDQTMVEFPDLQLTNDVFLAANKESAVDIFPVKTSEHLG